MADRPSTSDVFVGRREEMGQLERALKDVLSGSARVVMLAGEPGIGKTRLAQELAPHAQAEGARVLWGRCFEDVGTPPYWPWVQLIRSYAEGCDPETLRAEMGHGAAIIAEIVPELGELLPDLEPPRRVEDPDHARFRLFDSVATFLRSASQGQPLVIALEDLHWADAASLMLLEHIAKVVSDVRMLLLGTYRDVELRRGHPLAHTLGELRRERSFQRVVLRGLAEENVGELMRHASSEEPPAQLISDVHAQTEGNPLFVVEVVDLLEREGGLGADGVPPRDGLPPRIPEGVRETIGRLLDRLSEPCNEALAVASVIGQEFDVEVLSRVLGRSVDEMLDTLEEALSAHVIDEVPSAVGRHQFTHALVRQTLAEELSLTRRARLHARITETLEELYGDTAEANAAELAHHFVQAQAVLGTEKLVRYSIVAGERSLALYAFGEALAHFERALAAREGQPPDGETAAIWYGLSRAQTATLPRLRAQEALDNLIRAFDYYAEADDVPRALAAAQSWLFGGGHGLRGLTEMLLGALDLAPPDSPAAARLLARYGRHLGVVQGDYERARESIERAIAIAKREGDPALEMRTLFDSMTVESHNLHRQEALKKAQRVIELARELSDPLFEGWGHDSAFRALVALGDPEAALMHTDAIRSLREMLGRRDLPEHYLRGRFLSDHAPADLSRLLGDWEAARSSYDQQLAGQSYYRPPTAYAARALLEYEEGDPSQGEVFLERASEASETLVFGLTGTLLSLEMLIARIAGVERSTEELENHARDLVSGRHKAAIKVAARAGLGLIAVWRGDAQEATEHYPALAPQQGTMIQYFCTVMSADRLLGLLAHTMGPLDDAVGHFEDALAFCRKAGYRPELAWTCHDYADELLNTEDTRAGLKAAPTGAANREKGTALLDESLAISTELGMRPLMERVVALHEQAKSRPAESPAYPDGLTRREFEVLRLIIAGATNQEIGDALFITTNTVANHVKNILAKSNTANRTEAAAYGVRHRMAEE